MSGRGWSLVALALLVVAAGLGWVLVTGGHGTSTPAAPAQTATEEPTDAQQAAAALDRLAEDPASLVADGADAFVGGRAEQAVPPGTEVRADARSWAPDGLGGGTMRVTLASPGGRRATYLAVMASEDGEWKVLGTFPVPAAADGAGS